MKKLTQIISVLFTVILTTSVSWSGVDGKGLICKCIEKNRCLYSVEFGLWFENEKVKGRKFERLNDDIYTYIIPNEEWYFVSPTEIKWGYLSLNRKSLILTENNSPYFKDTVSKCILFVNKDNFEKYWENLELKLQSEYDEMTKDNKI